MIMTLYAARNLCRQIACFRVLLTLSPPPPPSPSRLARLNQIQPKSCIVIGQCIQWLIKTSPNGAVRRNRLDCDAVKAVPLAKRRPHINRCFTHRRSQCCSSSVMLLIVTIDTSVVRHLSISPSMISAGWFYFGEAILLYFILSAVIL